MKIEDAARQLRIAARTLRKIMSRMASASARFFSSSSIAELISARCSIDSSMKMTRYFAISTAQISFSSTFLRVSITESGLNGLTMKSLAPA